MAERAVGEPAGWALTTGRGMGALSAILLVAVVVGGNTTISNGLGDDSVPALLDSLPTLRPRSSSTAIWRRVTPTKSGTSIEIS